MAKLKLPSIRKKTPKLSAKAGVPSENLVYVGKERNEHVVIDIIDYTPTTIEERAVEHIAECSTYKAKNSVTWISVTGVHNPKIVQEVCTLFNIHPLIQEDILNTQQRTKIEEFEEYLFVTFKNLFTDAVTAEIDTEQISIILGSNYLISFQETENAIFEDIKYRIRTSKGTIRQHNSDYLLYKIMDAAVDNYFVVIDKIGDRVEDIEEEILYYPSQKSTFKIQAIKKDIQLMNKHILPMREALNKLEADVTDLIETKTLNYFRDVYDHTYLAYDTVENYRSLLSDLMNIYFSTMSNKLNQVMKVLTFISTIFMPLSFLAGVYGMNFKYFPGLNYPYAYHIFWVITLAVVISMVIFFRKKKWL